MTQSRDYQIDQDPELLTHKDGIFFFFKVENFNVKIRNENLPG